LQDGEYQQIEGLWLGMRRKDEELTQLRQQFESAQVQLSEARVEIEALLREKKALKDFQSMVRGYMSASFAGEGTLPLCVKEVGERRLLLSWAKARKGGL